MIRTFVAVVILALLSGCGGGGGGNSAVSVATGGVVGSGGGSNGMSFSPSTISFTVEYGTSNMFGVGATPSNPQEFASGAPVYVEIVDPQGVLQHSGPQPVVVRGQTAYAALSTSPTLPVGEYKGNFQVIACSDSACKNQLSGSPWNLPYDIQVKYILAVNPTADMDAGNIRYGTGPLPYIYTLQATGLTWSVTTDVPWLQTTASGTGSTTFDVTLDPTSLQIGPHSGHVTVTSTDGQVVTGTFSVSIVAAQQLGVTLSTQTGIAVDAGDLATGTGVSISGTAGVNWTLSSSVPWLVLQSTSGTLPANPIEVDVNAAGLTPGNYSGLLNVATSDGQSASATVSITVYPAGTPLISIYAGSSQLATSTLPPDSTFGLATSTFTAAVSMAGDGAGNFYVSDGGVGAATRKFGPDRTISFVSGAQCSSMGVDGQGNFYCQESSTNIVEFTPSGSSNVIFGVGYSGHVYPIAVNSAGGVYFVDSMKLSKVSTSIPSGQFVASLGTQTPGNPPVSTQTEVSDMIFDNAGNLILADWGNRTIRKVAPDGTITILAGQPGVAGTADGSGSAATFQAPLAIAMNAAGDFYVLDGGPVNLLRKVTAQGTVTTIGGVAGNGSFMAGPLTTGSLSAANSMVVVGNSLYFPIARGVGVVSHLP